MKEQINNAISWIKQQDKIKGCITGSCLLDYFEGQDIDVFVYNEKSLSRLLITMELNPMFIILDKLEEWKNDQFLNNEDNKFHKGITTVKYLYNTCVPVNVVLKKNCDNIFSVMSSFDMDIICKGYDIQTKQTLDLTGNSTTKKIVGWNKHNPVFYSDNIWEMSRILRQMERCIKYHNRGYNTDLVVLKFLEITKKMENFHNIFNSEKFEEKLDIVKQNTKDVQLICEAWLETHSISEEELEKLRETYKTL